MIIKNLKIFWTKKTLSNVVNILKFYIKRDRRLFINKLMFICQAVKAYAQPYALLPLPYHPLPPPSPDLARLLLLDSFSDKIYHKKNRNHYRPTYFIRYHLYSPIHLGSLVSLI